jgi:hypothetical protein
MELQYCEQAMHELAKTDKLIAFHIKRGINLEAVFNQEVAEDNAEFIQEYLTAYARIHTASVAVDSTGQLFFPF